METALTHPIAPPEPSNHHLPDLWEMLHQAIGNTGPQDLLAHLLDRVEARP
jgi:hypothetical protein